jgi:6-phosphogluconolactonase (cycloisomerase 2 family)
MSEILSSFGISENRMKRHIVAVAVLSGLVLAVIGICPAAVGDETHDHCKDYKLDCREFVYVVNGGSYDFSGYWINGATGVLEPISGSPFQGGPLFYPDTGKTQQIVVAAKGRFLYEVGSQIAQTFLLGYAIEPNGSLTQLPDVAIGGEGGSMNLALDPSDGYLYVSGYLPSVSVYKIDPATGALTPIPGSPFPSPGLIQSLVIDPTGRFVYLVALNANRGYVWGYRIDHPTGALTLISGSPFPAGDFSDGLTVDATGRFVYVSNIYGGNNNGGNISGFEIDLHTGALKPMPGSPFSLPEDGGAPDPPVADPIGRFLYVPLASSNNVAGYHIHPFTGELTPVAGSPFDAGTQPIGAAVDPTGRFVYVTDQNDGGPGSVQGFYIQPRSGSLRELPGSPFPAGQSSTSIVVGGRGDHR